MAPVTLSPSSSFLHFSLILSSEVSCHWLQPATRGCTSQHHIPWHLWSSRGATKHLSQRKAARLAKKPVMPSITSAGAVTNKNPGVPLADAGAVASDGTTHCLHPAAEPCRWMEGVVRDEEAGGRIAALVHAAEDRFRSAGAGAAGSVVSWRC